MPQLYSVIRNMKEGFIGASSMDSFMKNKWGELEKIDKYIKLSHSDLNSSFISNKSQITESLSVRIDGSFENYNKHVFIRWYNNNEILLVASLHITRKFILLYRDENGGKTLFEPGNGFCKVLSPFTSKKQLLDSFKMLLLATIDHYNSLLQKLGGMKNDFDLENKFDKIKQELFEKISN